MKRCPSCSFANGLDAEYCIRCGVALSGVTADDTSDPPPHAPVRPGYLAPGTLVDGKYRIERVLGEGGMGVVYLAGDIHTETPVVVKAIRAEFAHDPEFRARTLAEGRALARIDHPNVVRLNSVVVEPKTLYLVMQFIDGEPLDALIERHIAAHSPVPIALALSIFRMILRGVGAAHAEGLIHRDLKPANILVRRKDGVAKVTDFGIAKGEEDAKAGRGVTKGIIGSVAYMAPEQVRGRRDLDKRVDIYALGILLFELLIGRTPFEAPSDFEVMRMHAEAPMPSMAALRSDLPALLDDIVRRACAKERDHRFASTEEFLAALDAPPQLRIVPLAVLATAPLAAGSDTIGDVVATAGEPPWRPPSPSPPAPILPAARGITDEGSALPSAPAPAVRRPTALLAFGAVGAVLAVGGAVIYFASAPDDTGTGAASSSSSPTKGANAAASDARANGVAPPPNGGVTAPTADGAPRSSASASEVGAGSVSSALAALAGPWRSTSNRDYLAVATSSDTLEFRIQQASQHPRQGYENGDVRFKLTAIPGKDAEFVVEDHIRPTPPARFEYDPRASRESCLGTWTSVKGRKLLGRVDGKGTLIVDLVQIRTGLDKFKLEGDRVAACIDVASAPAEPIESRLSRVR